MVLPVVWFVFKPWICCEFIMYWRIKSIHTIKKVFCFVHMGFIFEGSENKNGRYFRATKSSSNVGFKYEQRAMCTLFGQCVRYSSRLMLKNSCLKINTAESPSIQRKHFIRRNSRSETSVRWNFLQRISLRQYFLTVTFPYGEISYGKIFHGEISFSEISDHGPIAKLSLRISIK